MAYLLEWGDEPARILEIISPAGFERYFEELADSEQPLDPQKVLALAARYDVELDFGSIPHLIKEHGYAPWCGLKRKAKFKECSKASD